MARMTTTIALSQLDIDTGARRAFSQAMRELQLNAVQACALLATAPLGTSARRRLIQDCRAVLGSSRMQPGTSTALRGPLLTSPVANPKLAKDSQVPIWSLSLAPAAQSGQWHVCPGSTPACEAGCLGWYSGHSGMTLGDNPVRRARRARTRALMDSQTQLSALILLRHELQTAADRAQGQIAVRLNAFSDIPWEQVWPALFHDPVLANVLWYDYTKLPNRRPPKNYRLTLSWTPQLDRAAGDWLSRGHTVAMVFGVRRPQDLPGHWRGWPVLDGTASDARWTDPAGHIVGLTWKASRNWAASCQAAQQSGWVVDPSRPQTERPLGVA